MDLPLLTDYIRKMSPHVCFVSVGVDAEGRITEYEITNRLTLKREGEPEVDYDAAAEKIRGDVRSGPNLQKALAKGGEPAVRALLNLPSEMTQDEAILLLAD